MPAYTLPYTGVIEVPANTILGNNTGSAAAAIGLTQAQTLTFLGDPGGAFGADVDTQITPSTAVVLDHAVNSEAALSLAYTTNKAGGDDTGLLIAMTDTASPGTSLPLDVQVGGSSILSVTEAGTLQADLLTAVAPAATDVPISVTGAAAQSANLQEWAVSGGEVHARVTDFGEFSNSGPGGIAGNYQNELFGLDAGDALTTGHSNAVMGWGALGAATTGHSNVAIGNSALAALNGNRATAVGYYAGKTSGGATQSVMLGAYTGGASNYATTDCVFIGYQADTAGLGATSSGIICIGSQSECDVDNTFVAGSSTFPANNVYFGKGLDNATPTAYTVNGTGGSGTDIAGADINIAGGIGTGTGVGGDVVIQYAAAGSTGTAANTLAAALTVDGGTGNATFGGDIAVTAPTVPASAAATGTTGTIAWDASYVYVCTATDTWKRVAIATW